MALYNSLAVGNAKGSAGNITFSSAFGIRYFKGKAVSVANPRTPEQTKQRLALALVTSTWQKIQNFGQVAYKERAVKMSAYNQFAKQNLSQSKMTIDEVAKTAVWQTGAIEVKANPNQQGTENVTISSPNCSGAIESLPASRSFTLYALGQDDQGNIGIVLKFKNSTDASGILNFSVNSSDFGLPNLWACYLSISDDVTGEVSNFTFLP